MVQEPGFEPGMTRPFKGRRYACSLLLHGAGGRIRTGRHGGLSTVAIPIRYASKSLVGRGRLELPCSGRLVLSEVCLPDSTTGPCPGRASNPQNCGSQPQASADCATWTSGARGRTRTYVATKATGLRPVSFATHSPARVHTQVVKELGGEPGTRTPMCRGDGILAGFWATDCPCSPQR